MWYHIHALPLLAVVAGEVALSLMGEAASLIFLGRPSAF